MHFSLNSIYLWGPGKYKRIIRLLLIVGLVICAVLAGVWYHDWPVHHFGTVEKGILYRSGQPTEQGWNDLRKWYGIKTVVDLRQDLPNEPWSILERDFSRRHGIKLVKIKIYPGPIEPEKLKQFIDIVSEPQNHPVLIHCEHGSSRTGIMVAAYRVMINGWSYERALKESHKYKKPMNAPYATYLQELANRRMRGEIILDGPNSADSVE